MCWKGKFQRLQNKSKGTLENRQRDRNSTRISEWFRDAEVGTATYFWTRALERVILRHNRGNNSKREEDAHRNIPK